MPTTPSPEFLANMSHELRTPMHAILSFAGLGLSRAGSIPGAEKLNHYFQRIRESGERLLALVNDLLDLSKLEAGKMSFEPRPVNLRPLIREAAGEMESLLQEKSLHLVLDERGPAEVYCDPPALRPADPQPALQRHQVLPRGRRHPGGLCPHHALFGPPQRRPGQSQRRGDDGARRRGRHFRWTNGNWSSTSSPRAAKPRPAPAAPASGWQYVAKSPWPIAVPLWPEATTAPAPCLAVTLPTPGSQPLHRG